MNIVKATIWDVTKLSVSHGKERQSSQAWGGNVDWVVCPHCSWHFRRPPALAAELRALDLTVNAIN